MVELSGIGRCELGIGVSDDRGCAESVPRCLVNVTQSVYWWDFVEVACSVNFSGTWKPLFHCASADTPEGNSDDTLLVTRPGRHQLIHRPIGPLSAVHN